MIIRDSLREDYAAIARLMQYTHSFPADEEKLVELEETRSKDSPYLRQVAVVDGNVVAYSKSQKWEIHRPLRYILAVGVDPGHRRQGIGGKLYEIADAHGRQSGAQELWIQFVEGDEVGRAFAERRGYSHSFYLQDLTLPVANFDFRPFEGVVESVQASGIQFRPFSLLGETNENRRKLYDLNVIVERDVPTFGQDDFMSYEDWERKHLKAKWFDSAGQMIALDGDKWIGLGAVGEFYSGTHVNAITGVLREYRGRKIGLALKLLGIEFAKSRGAKELRTQNHGTNAPMLAINKRLGYHGLPGWYTYRKTV